MSQGFAKNVYLLFVTRIYKNEYNIPTIKVFQLSCAGMHIQARHNVFSIVSLLLATKQLNNDVIQSNHTNHYS